MRKRELSGPFGAGEDCLEQLSLLFEHTIDSLLDRIERQEPCDSRGTSRANAMGTIDCLILDGRIPPAVKEKYVAGELQIQAHGAGAVTHQYHAGRRVVAKPADHRVAAGVRNLAVVFQRPKPSQGLREPLDRADPLAEDDRLPPAAGDFFQVGFEPLQLGARSGGRVEVADLLQPQHELEDVLDRRGVAHLRQPHNALFLGQPIGLALFRRQFQIRVAKHFRRQFGKHLLLGPPQDIVADRAAHLPRLHVGREKTRREKLEDSDEVIRAVLHRRSRQSPTAAPRKAADDLTRRAAAVFDPLRFVQHHEIERDRPALVTAFQNVAVADKQFIVGDAHGHVGQPPLPRPTRLVPFNYQRQHLRGPKLELPRPIRHQRLGTDHKHAADFAAAEQKPDRGDRLHCFAEAHFVCQYCRVARIEKGHAFELKRKRLKRHRQFAIGQQGFQRRLQQIMQAVFQLDDILGRADARIFVALPALTRIRRIAGLAGRSGNLRRERRVLHFRKLRELKTAQAHRSLSNGNRNRDGPRTFEFE